MCFCYSAVSACDGDGGGFGVPVDAFYNIVPLVLCAFEVDARKAGATIEDKVSNARHAVGDGDARKTGALHEGRFADIGHAIWNNNTLIQLYHSVLSSTNY